MDGYKNIVKVDPQDDGSMNLVLRNGKRALIRVRELDKRFRAEIYHLLGGVPEEKEDLLKRLGQHEGFQECAREALGWVDENPELVEAPADSGQKVEE